MKQTGEWVKGTGMYRKDLDYIVNNIVQAFVRPSGAQWRVFEMLEHNVSFHGFYDDLETAKAVAVALVAMR